MLSKILCVRFYVRNKDDKDEKEGKKIIFIRYTGIVIELGFC